MRHVVILAAALSLGGCVSTAGPFVTRVGSDGDGNVLVERCTLKFNRMFNVVDAVDCERGRVRLEDGGGRPRVER